MYKENSKNSVGGQAVIEGVLMRSPRSIALAIRKPSGEIALEKEENVAWSKRHPILGIFLIRGIATLIETLAIGMKSLVHSADVAMEAEGKRVSGWEYGFSFVLSFAIAITLFFVFPAFIFSQLKIFNIPTIMLNIIEGIIRISMFLIFLFMVSFMPDMRRIFEYHGAEHKSIYLYENLKKRKETDIANSLTIEEAKKFSPQHPGCGTSFVIIILIISVFVFSFLGRPSFVMRVVLKLSLLPIIIGLAYEFIKFSARHRDNPLVKILITPGLFLQKLTTREPSDDQIEVALEAIKAVI